MVEQVPVIQPGADGTYKLNSFDASEERQVEVRAHDRDSDQLLRAFLARIDAFLSPLNAPVTARVLAGAASASPFERVARDKAAMLGRDDVAASPLLQFVQGVRAIDVGDKAQTLEAKRSLREACASEMERFHSVGGVLVKPLASKIPAGWFQDEPRPKIYGRLKFDGVDNTALGFRAFARGIELREGQMQLGITVLPESQEQFVDLAARGAVSYECTHVERIIETTIPGRLAPSRWLTLVPVSPQPAAQLRLPLIELAAKGQKLITPMPLRNVPAAPEIAAPVLAPYVGDPVATYEQSVAAARRWSFGFDLAAEFKPGDQYCGRLIYNGGLGDSQVSTQTPADPLFPALFAALVGFEARTVPYWDVITQEAARRVSGPGSAADQTRFENACARFAEAVADVVAGLQPQPALAAAPKLLEDRFIITDEKNGAGRRARIRFVDHLEPMDPVRKPEAGEGDPSLIVTQILNSGPNAPSKTTKNGPGDVTFEFSKPDAGLGRRHVEVGRLDALRLQSIWTAGSVRRNAEIDHEPAHRRFIYRTAEVYLQQVSVPNLVRRDSIVFDSRKAETLEQRLERALAPVFKGQDGAVPVQARFDFESGRMVQLLTDLAAGGAGPEFYPDPDAKVQYAGLEVGPAPAWSVASLAAKAAASLRTGFTIEPVAQTGRIVIAITLRTADPNKIGQPLLRLSRLIVPLEKLTDV